ncbi:hypothetical protein V6Z11_D11G183300 [Gossypium hirsutum]|uniref:Pathogenesis-related thaumatin-like protein 3.5 n=1 Tax=Gossypium hirsutum TaxID=3635 RepID=A0A1U8KGI2_GOSHI|nr:pathogenesis-related thaumatin-like protein 3.5 [Gossypium hirsutum]
MNSSSHLPLFSILLVVLGLTVSQSTNVSGAYSSTFTIVNNCNYTVWPAVVSYPQSTQISPSGFILQPGESTSISVPPSWSGRISGRTHCGTDSSGNFSCLTGDCGTSRPECSGNSSIQATLAEFYFNSSVGSDFYDVSLVDGFNLPLMISPHGGTGDDCNSTGCVADLNGDCPSELKVVNGSETVACKSACTAFGPPQYCCDTTNTCKPTSYEQFFKSRCPNAYSYPQDDANSTFSCFAADYDITFCPSPSTRTNGSAAKRVENKTGCHKCNASGGTCGSDSNNRTICHCPSGFYNSPELKQCLGLAPLPGPVLAPTYSPRPGGSNLKLTYSILIG